MSGGMSWLRPRDRVQRYQLLERLGRGGFAEAWRARRLVGLFEDEVCIKLPLGASSHAEQRSAPHSAPFPGAWCTETSHRRTCSCRAKGKSSCPTSASLAPSTASDGR